MKNRQLKFIIFVLIILIIPINVKGEESYKKDYVDDLYVNKNLTDDILEKEKLVVCTYKCSEDNKSKCNDNEFGAIYYNHDNNNYGEFWNMNINLHYLNSGVMGTSTNIEYNIGYQWREIGNLIPHRGIYFEEPDTNNVNQSWKDKDAYKDLKNSFVCPQYIYFDHSLITGFDKKNNMELCFANEKEQCMKRNEEEKTKFGKANNLEYSFSKELNDVLDNTITSIQGEYPEDVLRNFLLADSGYECSSLLEDYDSTSLINEIFDNELINYYDSKIKSSVPSDSINKNFYNYKNLVKLFEPEKSKNTTLNIKYNNIDLTKKYNEMKMALVEKITTSIKHCEIKTNMTNQSNIDINVVEEQLNIKIEKMIPDYKKMEFEELNCDNIFAEIADMIKMAYFIIELLAIILVVVLSIVDYSKVILSDNQDEMKKSNKKLITRLIIVVVILLLPALINMILKLLNIQGFNSERPLCIEIKNK